jgi:quinol monooxygenase YgiN
MIIVHGKLRLLAGSESEAVAAAKRIVAEARKEEGVIDYSFYFDLLDSRHLGFVEVWRDQDALHIHSRSKHMAEFWEAVTPLLESRAVKVFDASQVR